MPKFSKKVMGKEVGDASVYAMPHTPDGKPLKTKTTTGAQELANMNISVDGISKGVGQGVDQYGKIETRGNGAATKGRMASGKMG